MYNTNVIVISLTPDWLEESPCKHIKDGDSNRLPQWENAQRTKRLRTEYEVI